MKKQIMVALLASTFITAGAQEKKSPSWINNVKLSGYGMMQYQYS